MRIVVGIATAGRREILSETLLELSRQSRRPAEILVCPAAPEDFDAAQAARLPVPVRHVAGEKGSSAQRNAVLDEALDSDLLVFFDDDFFPAAGFLEEAERLFAARPDVAVATGAVLADGIHGPGLTPAEARAVLAADKPPAQPALAPIHNAYGCNMVFRTAAIRAARARFDEALPLYGWQEDADFSRQLLGQGAIVEAQALRGVHLGNKRGRTSGLRFGYSQVANPLYLVRKGTMGPRRALRLAAGNIAANLVGSLRNTGLVDRRGRLRGNALALWDALRGRSSPRRILDLPHS